MQSEAEKKILNVKNKLSMEKKMEKFIKLMKNVLLLDCYIKANSKN